MTAFFPLLHHKIAKNTTQDEKTRHSTGWVQPPVLCKTLASKNVCFCNSNDQLAVRAVMIRSGGVATGKVVEASQI